MQISISKLEHQTMNVVWDLKQCTIKEVHEIMTHKKKVAYTTIATILLRLHKKGLVIRKMDRTIYYYSPKITKEKYSNNLISSFFKNTVDSLGDVAIPSFAESIEKLPDEKRIYLLKLLEQYGKNK